MKDLKTSLLKLKTLKSKQSEIRKALKNEQEQLLSTTDIPQLEQTLRAKRREVRNILKAENPHLYNKLEDLKIDIETEKELMSDIALSMLMKGEPVEVEDGDERYEPSINVNFKKL